MDAVETGSVYVHCDVTAVFPWLTHALFSTGARRQPMRLMDELPLALALLDREVKRRRPALLRTLEWSPRRAKAARLQRPGVTVR